MIASSDSIEGATETNSRIRSINGGESPPANNPQMNACSCLTLIFACIVYWQAREISRLQDRQREADRTRPLGVGERFGAVELLAHVVGDGRIEVGFRVREPVRHGIGDPLRKQRLAVGCVTLRVFLQRWVSGTTSPRRPRPSSTFRRAKPIPTVSFGTVRTFPHHATRLPFSNIWRDRGGSLVHIHRP